jgi:hypothetical protein
VRVELDWKAADDDGVWETVATYRTRHGVGVPRWIWIVLCSVIVACSTTSYLIVRRHYVRAIRQMTFQLQSVIDLEAGALAASDMALYMRQQDPSARDWVAEQAARVTSDLLQCTGRAVPAFARYNECPSVQSAEVQRVEMRGDVAWVEVVDAGNPVRQARFYRQTSQGWLHTEPRASFWSGTIERRFDGLVVRYSQRDRPHIEPLLAHLARVVSEVDAALPQAPHQALYVDLTGTQLEGLPDLTQDRLVLASPWLTGVPIDGKWKRAEATTHYLDLLSYWAAYARVGQYLHDSTGTRGELAAHPGRLTQLEAAIASEYATIYTRRDLAQAPVLRRILARHGDDALPAVLGDVASGSSSAEFADRWLSVSPSGRSELFLGALADIEREAARLQQGNTVRLAMALFPTSCGTPLDFAGSPYYD